MTQVDLDRIRAIEERIDLLEAIIRDLKNEKNRIILSSLAKGIPEKDAKKIMEGEKP